jgi:hypothetical protein
MVDIRGNARRRGHRLGSWRLGSLAVINRDQGTLALVLSLVVLGTLGLVACRGGDD